MNADEAAALRKPFEPHQIGHLPKGGAQLAYVGHSAVVDRLLAVDPCWWWEPMALDEDGLPKIVYGKTEAVMWGRLHVCGMSRLEVGTCAVNAFELHKQLVSDFLRRGAMRFGVALDLWSKEELHPADKPVKRRSGKSEGSATPASGETPKPAVSPSPAVVSRLCHKCGEPITGKVMSFTTDEGKHRYHEDCVPVPPAVASEIESARAALDGAP